MALTPVAPTISNVTATGFKIDVNPDGNPPTTYYAFKVVYGSTTKYVDGTGQLQDTKIFLNLTTLTVVNAVPNTIHSITLTAADDAVGTNESVDGPAAGATTLAADPVASTWLNVFSTTAKADWTANDNPSGTEYYAEIATDSNFLANVQNSGWITDLGHIFSNMLPNTTYYGRVKARNSAVQETSYVSLGTVTTSIGPDTVKVIRVYNLLAERGYLITWQPNQETNIVSYKVYRSSSPTDSSEFEALATIPVPITSYIDKVPYSFGLVYYYKVSAVDDGGNESSLELISPAHENTYHSFEEQPFIQNVKQSDFINDEVPTGEINDVNALYTLNFPYRPGTVQIYQDGIKIRSGIDFTEGPLSQQITFASPPSTGTDIRANYVKY